MSFPPIAFVADAFDGAVRGSYIDDPSLGNVVGQTIAGELPIVGWASDARDLSADFSNLLDNPTSVGPWVSVAGSVGAFLPFGSTIKAAIRGSDALAHSDDAVAGVAAAAKGGRADVDEVPHTPNVDEQFGEGATSRVYREGDSVRKVVKDEVAADGGDLAKITDAERDFIAKNTTDLANQLHDAMPDIIPKMTSPRPGEIVQPFVQGKELSQLSGAADRAARKNMRDAIAKAHDELGLQPGAHGEYPDNGFLVKVDPNSANFRFDEKGDIVSWFDPVSIVPPKGRAQKGP